MRKMTVRENSTFENTNMSGKAIEQQIEVQCSLLFPVPPKLTWIAFHLTVSPTVSLPVVCLDHCCTQYCTDIIFCMHGISVCIVLALQPWRRHPTNYYIFTAGFIVYGALTFNDFHYEKSEEFYMYRRAR